MDTGVMVLGTVACVLLGCTLVGGPMLLVDWARMRREAVIARQIVLTDALDAQLGPLVAPVVKKPLFGPWEVRIAIPRPGSVVLARIIAVTDQVFADVEGTPPMPYRMLLSLTPNSWRAVERVGRRSVERWPGNPVTAA